MLEISPVGFHDSSHMSKSPGYDILNQHKWTEMQLVIQALRTEKANLQASLVKHMKAGGASEPWMDTMIQLVEELQRENTLLHNSLVEQPHRIIKLIHKESDGTLPVQNMEKGSVKDFDFLSENLTPLVAESSIGCSSLSASPCIPRSPWHQPVMANTGPRSDPVAIPW